MTPKFTKTKVKEKETLGEKLAKKRASLGYEIKDIERSIKIRAIHVEYIEKGEWNKLPPDVFVRGFLRSYARHLKLDPEKVLGLYFKERGMQEFVKKATAPPKKNDTIKKKKQKVIVTPKRLAFLSILVVAFLVIIYIGWQVSILTAAPKLELSTPNENSKTNESSVVFTGSTDAGSSVYINNIPIGVSPEGDFSEEVSLKDGINVINISAKNKLDKETEIIRTVVAELEEAIISNNHNDNGLLMKIEIGPNSTSVYIEADGKPITSKDSVMLPGSSQTVKATDSIIISASDGGSVRVKINDEDFGKLGNSGEKVERKEYK